MADTPAKRAPFYVETFDTQTLGFYWRLKARNREILATTVEGEGPALARAVLTDDGLTITKVEPPAWDCYSPVAEILWLAADNAQNGVRFPVASAHSRLKFSGRGELFEPLDPWRVIDEALGYAFYSGDVSNAERAVGLRIAAEFGPEGRPR